VSSAIATPIPSLDRLERFRAARAKLDPAGDPAHAMERFYVDAPRSVSARIAAELALAPASSHLLVGGVGSGKTTELMATARHVAAISDVATLYVDVTRQHDIDKMAPGAIIAQVGPGLAEQLQEFGPSPHIQSARDVAYGGIPGRNANGDTGAIMKTMMAMRTLATSYPGSSYLPSKLPRACSAHAGRSRDCCRPSGSGNDTSSSCSTDSIGSPICRRSNNSSTTT
jgi:hypothetical protein